MTRFSSLLLSSCLLLASGVAAAQQPPPPGYAPPPPGYTPPPPGYAPPPPGYAPPPPYAAPPGYYVAAAAPGREQHDGLYLRLFLGGGRLAMSESQGGNSIGAHGAAASFGVALGGAVVENLILYGEFYFLNAQDPTFELNGVSMNSNGIALVSGGVGPGMAYYFQPVNIYLSATVGLSKVQIQNDNSGGTNTVVASTKWGFGLSTMLGKEFWVSDNWGIGAALQFHWGSMEDNVPAPAPRVYSNAVSLLFSSTFN